MRIILYTCQAENTEQSTMPCEKFLGHFESVSKILLEKTIFLLQIILKYHSICDMYIGNKENSTDKYKLHVI